MAPRFANLVRGGDVSVIAPALTSGEGFGVRALDPNEDVLELDADVLVEPPQVRPVAARRKLEAVVVGLDLGVTSDP